MDSLGKFVIVRDLSLKDVMTDSEGNIKLFDTFDDAAITCGMYEFENAFILKVVSKYEEPLEAWCGKMYYSDQ